MFFKIIVILIKDFKKNDDTIKEFIGKILGEIRFSKYFFKEKIVFKIEEIKKIMKLFYILLNTYKDETLVTSPVKNIAKIYKKFNFFDEYEIWKKVYEMFNDKIFIVDIMIQQMLKEKGKNKYYEIFLDILKKYPEKELSAIVADKCISKMLHTKDNHKFIFTDKGMKIIFKCLEKNRQVYPFLLCLKFLIKESHLENIPIPENMIKIYKNMVKNNNAYFYCYQFFFTTLDYFVSKKKEKLIPFSFNEVEVSYKFLKKYEDNEKMFKIFLFAFLHMLKSKKAKKEDFFFKEIIDILKEKLNDGPEEKNKKLIEEIMTYK